MGYNHTVKYNIVTDDGDASSVTVFLAGGGQLVATADHPNFTRICDALTSNPTPKESNIKGLFDISVGVREKISVVTERVTISKGQVYLDHDRMAGPLVDAILRFYEADEPNWKPLVAFMEKVMQNPNEHSRVQLFRWLEKHHYAICDDGDFIAYKGVKSDGRSSHAGKAFVNGVLTHGNIPNKPGTIIEMPRSEVEFAPGVACSHGLHVANWSYAKTFVSGPHIMLRCKINPRDVVSVPTDSGDAKIRVCRYRILDVVQMEDRSLMYAGAYRTVKVPAPAPEPAVEEAAATSGAAKRGRKAAAKPAPKKPAAKKAASKKAPARVEPEPVEQVWPEHYEDFTKADFLRLEFKEMVWLAGEWEVKVPAPRTKADYVLHLNKDAQRRRRAIKKANG